MLLKALYDFAHSRKLLDDLAFAPKSIRWVIQLDDEGNLIGTGPIDTSEDGKRGRIFSAPKKSGSKNSGGVAEFLSDGLTAVFGVEQEPEKLEGDEKKRQSRLDNNAAKYQNFWQQIQATYDETQNQALSALLKFHNAVGTKPSFLRWRVKDESNTKERPAWWIKTAKGDEIKYKADNFSFSISGNLVLEEQLLRDWWQNVHEQNDAQKDENTERGICLITGAKNEPIARTHFPKIEIGFKDTPPGGAAIVSFEKSSPAFSSFGFVQSYNAPTSTSATTAYCEAIRHLLKSKNHSLRIGKTIVCFWARDSEEATDVFSWAFDQPKPESVRDFLSALRTGAEQPLAQPDEFYSVTLSGNGGRVVVRHWMQMPLESAVGNLRQWFSDLHIASYGNPSANGKILPLALFRLACTTVRDAKDLQPDVPAQLYRSALDGTAPPLSLLNPILNRLKADLCKFGTGILETPISGKVIREMTDSRTPVPPPGQSRAALIRIILNRNNQNRKEGDSMIQPQVFETNDPAYNCGRLLALFDDLQREALSTEGNTFDGAGVVEKYYGSASSAPNSAFGILWRLHQHHLKKVSQKGDKGKAAAFAIKRKIAEIAARFPQPAPLQPPQFPRTFNLQEQGRFALGFYQQKAADDAARRKHRAINDNQNNQNNQ